MERIQQFQSIATVKIQEYQKACDAKGCGHLGLGVAGGLMLFVFCPMSIVAVAAPYWTFSSDVNGATFSAKASLWELSVSTEIGGSSTESEVGMCSDEMPDFDDCGKIDAVRFFVITALLLSLASAITFMFGFSPKPTAALRRKMSIAGVSLAAVVLVWNFLGVCIAASINVADNYKLSGAGFVFLVLELFFVTLALALAVCTMTRWSAAPQPATDAHAEEAVKPQPPAPTASSPTPTLLTVVGASAESGSESKTNIQVAAAQNNETE